MTTNTTLKTDPLGDSADYALESSSPKTLATSNWIEFLVGDTDALPLRVFEVLFTMAFLSRMGLCFLTWREWLTEEGFHLNAAELKAMGYPLPFELLSGIGVALLAIMMGVSALALICNRCRRLALLGLFASAVYVQGADQLSAFTVNRMFIGVYGILLFSPGYTRDPITGRLMVSAVAVRVLQATVILQYFAAGCAKAFKGDWLKYSDVLYTHVQGMTRTDFAAWMLRTFPVWSWTVMQWTALLFELEAPLIFCLRRLRPVVFTLGIGFHLMIALLMKDLVNFSALMWSFYALFITGDEWRAIGATLTRWIGMTGRGKSREDELSGVRKPSPSA